MSQQPIAYQETNMRLAFQAAMSQAAPENFDLMKKVGTKLKKGLGRIPRYKLWRVVRGTNKE